MKTIILCGGEGTRLKEETEFKPKPMVFIGKKPILWHIMKIYAYAGFNEFILALGYKADYIKDFFLNQKAFTSDFTLRTKSHKTTFYLSHRAEIEDFKITFVDTGIDTLPGERILRCRDYLSSRDKNFIVTYGDAVTDLDIRDLVAFHHKQKTLGTIAGVHPHSRYGMVKIGNNNKVTQFYEKPILSDWINSGHMIFDTSILEEIQTGESEHPVLKRLTKRRQLSVYKHEGFWVGMDTYKEVGALNKMWRQTNPPWKIWK